MAMFNKRVSCIITSSISILSTIARTRFRLHFITLYRNHNKNSLLSMKNYVCCIVTVTYSPIKLGLRFEIYGPYLYFLVTTHSFRDLRATIAFVDKTADIFTCFSKRLFFAPVSVLQSWVFHLKIHLRLLCFIGLMYDLCTTLHRFICTHTHTDRKHFPLTLILSVNPVQLFSKHFLLCTY